MLQPTTGQLLVDGEVARPYQKLSVAYVPQPVYLTDGTLRSNIAFGINESEIDEARLAAAVSSAGFAFPAANGNASQMPARSTWPPI